MSDCRKKRILVYTENRYLFQKIRLELISEYDCTLADSSSVTREDFPTVIWDLSLGEPYSKSLITLGDSGDIPLPLPLGVLSEFLSKESPPLFLSKEERLAVLKGRSIKLTELEFELLFSLYERGGEFVSREELLCKIWGSEADGGILNVYVHYLREKLETEGEKIILSSRKQGYRIDEKYFGGKRNA